MKLWWLLFYLPVLLVFAAGVWQMASPLAAWKLRRLSSQTRGLATTDEPQGGALRVIRWQGFALTAFTLVFAIVLAVFMQGLQKG